MQIFRTESCEYLHFSSNPLKKQASTALANRHFAAKRKKHIANRIFFAIYLQISFFFCNFAHFSLCA